MPLGYKYCAPGFRELVTRINLTGVYSNKEVNCSCLLIESIPSGIYVDLNELKNREANGGPKVCFYIIVKIYVCSMMLADSLVEYWS